MTQILRAHAASKPLLSVQDLRVEAASGAILVDDVSFDLQPGEVIGLIGESGAGKSTIGLAALGYSRTGCSITGGRILFNGEDLLALPPARRRGLRGRHIGYIAQSAGASFNPALRISGQVCEVPVTTAMLGKHAALERSIELFTELELPNPKVFGNYFPHQVSGGQLQRAMAAMAMAGKPDVLVFDEPTTALDVTTQVEVLAVFKNIVRNHATAAIYIAHDLAVVAQIADRIMVLRHGRMVEFGDTRAVLEAPRQDYTRRLIQEKSTTYPAPPKAAAAQPLLSLRGVAASYKSLRNVVQDIDLDLHAGETLAIVGESGSGKSTLARVIVGLLPPDAGSISFVGDTLSPSFRQRSREQLRRVQMVYQSPDVALNPRHTVGETLERPIRFYFNASRRDAREGAAELLHQIELPPELMTRRTSTLSGGQKQRLCIARALAARPDVIICDEVTSALDQLVAEEILALLRRLQDKLNIGILFITHDMGTVKRFAGKVIVMKKGRVLDRGATEAVFASPGHDYTALLLSSVPQLRPGWLEEALEARASHRAAPPLYAPPEPIRSKSEGTANV